MLFNINVNVRREHTNTMLLDIWYMHGVRVEERYALTDRSAETEYHFRMENIIYVCMQYL